jgi:ribosome-associated protein
VFKQKLLALHDRRISRDGVIVIRAQRYRSQEQNRIDALERLQLLLRKAAEPVKCRRVTVPSGKSKEKRLETKTRRGHIKKLRRKAWEKEDG